MLGYCTERAIREGRLWLKAEAGTGYFTLVVRLQPEASGGWQLIMDDAQTTQVIALRPATFIIRLYRQTDAASVRGTIRLGGSGQIAPVQSNLTQIEALVYAWLLDTNRTGGA